MPPKKGYPDAEYNLGFGYNWGKGVAQDDAEAYVWLSLAATNGDAAAASLCDDSADKLSLPALEQAQARAKKLFEAMQGKP